MKTYDFFGTPGDLRHVAGSSLVFLVAVEAAILGLLGGTVAHAGLGLLGLSIAVGVVVLLLHFTVSVWLAYRSYLAVWKSWRPLYPTPGA